MSDLNVNSKMFVDDPMVHSAKLFVEGLKNNKNGDFENALPLFERYQKHHPEDPKVYFEMAYCKHLYGQNDEALKLVDRAISLDPEFGEAVGLKGYIMVMNKKYNGALNYLHIGNSLVPKTEFILDGLYIANANIGNYKSAVMYLEQLIEIKPLFLNYRYSQALLYQDLGQLDKAITIMEKVVAQIPDETTFTEYLDDLKQAQGENVGPFHLGMNN